MKKSTNSAGVYVAPTVGAFEILTMNPIAGSVCLDDLQEVQETWED